MSTIDTPLLVEWLTQQIAEDERLALAVEQRGPWTGEGAVYEEGSGCIAAGPYGCEMGDAEVAHIIRHDPARVLREVAAKRKVLELHEYATAAWALDRDKFNPPTVHLGASTMTTAVLSMLAEIYEDRPGFNPDWRVDDLDG